MHSVYVATPLSSLKPSRCRRAPSVSISSEYRALELQLQQGRHWQHVLQGRPLRCSLPGSVECAMADSTASSVPLVFSSQFLDDGEQDSSLGLIILNRPLPWVTSTLWRRARLRVCADGGANRLHDELPGLLPGQLAAEVREAHLPDLITGDLDSIRPDVADFYRARGVPLVDLSHDQITCDMQKSVQGLQKLQAQLGDSGSTGGFTMVAAGGLGGRLDHTLANLSILHEYRNTRLVLCGDGNIARLIPKGRSLIKPNRRVEGPTCGLIPLRGPAIGVSTGLRWNLDETLTLELGGRVSSSNTIDGDEITLQSDADMVWMVEYNDDLYRPGL